MNRQLSQDIGKVHFVGIGGIGMSGIAELMYHLGYCVSGSDLSMNPQAVRLRGLGIEVFQGHHADHLVGVDCVVRSSAIKADNLEIVAARAVGIPIVHRAEMLGEMMYLKKTIAVAGSHGKTTTTSMIAHLLLHCGLDPTVINGGVIQHFGSNARLGGGDWMVIEADESDGSFVRLPAVAAVVTNIDSEHLDHYGDFDKVREAFVQFVGNVPFFGFLVLCTDHPEVQSLRGGFGDRRVIGYGLNPHAEVRADKVRMEGGVQCFDLHLHSFDGEESFEPRTVRIGLPGDHNICNALAAIAVARALGLELDAIVEGIESFEGVRRRFQRIACKDGVELIDDYAHHPVEIRAVLHAARRVNSARLIVLFQPHRFSRLHGLYDDFLSALAETDSLLVLPIYAAGEVMIDDCDHQKFARDIGSRGHRDAVAIGEGLDEIVAALNERICPGDLVLCLGAGSISQIAHGLPEALGWSALS